MEPWKRLLDYISRFESNGSYDAVFGNARNKVPLSQWTVDDLLAKKHLYLTKRGQTAAGRYQIINKTLRSLKEKLGLSGREKFTPELQDRLGYQLLKDRGYEKFMAGKLSLPAFALGLAQEWASLPVLYPVNGKKRGQSYYAGDGLNAAHAKADEFEALLKSLRIPHVEKTEPKPAETVAKTSESWLTRLLRLFT